MPRLLLKPNKPIISAILVMIGVAVSVYILFPNSASDVIQRVLALL